MGVSKISDHIKIKIKISNHSQEPPASFKAHSQDIKDMNILCTFKIKIESNLEPWVYQRPVTISKSRFKF